MIITFTCWDSLIPGPLLYFLSLGRYHNTIYTSALAPLDKCTPIYIVRQYICFTLIELFHQIHFKTKIPKTPPTLPV